MVFLFDLLFTRTESCIFACEAFSYIYIVYFVIQ